MDINQLVRLQMLTTASTYGIRDLGLDIAYQWTIVVCSRKIIVDVIYQCVVSDYTLHCREDQPCDSCIDAVAMGTGDRSCHRQIDNRNLYEVALCRPRTPVPPQYDVLGIAGAITEDVKNIVSLSTEHSPV